LLLATAASLPAQYALSAMAGYIHYTEGEVWLGERAIAPKAQDFEHVLEGRRLRTGRGRAEILLVPGSFVRLGQGSEIEMISAGLTDATLRLISGSLAVDLQNLFEKDSIAVLTGDSEIRFRKIGLYRIDANDSPALQVEDGRARVVAAGREIEVKSGQKLMLGQASPEKLAKAAPDALDEWNETRHEKLGVLAEQARDERSAGMSEAERELLRMILRQPSRTVTNAPPSPPPSAPRPQGSRP
jgi:hypothetical protein